MQRFKLENVINVWFLPNCQGTILSVNGKNCATEMTETGQGEKN